MGAGGRGVNTIVSDASGEISTHGHGTLVDDSSFHPLEVSKLSTPFKLGLKSLCSHDE